MTQTPKKRYYYMVGLAVDLYVRTTIALTEAQELKENP